MRSISISPPLQRMTLLSGAAILALAAACPAVAQDTQGAPPASAESAQAPDSSNDIVVTARNRKEKLQEVPLAITALSGEQLATAGVRNLREISYLTPGVTINSAGGEAYTQPIIRGLVNLNGGASDPNVAVFLDGVYLVNNSAISVGLIDIQRVEIVKGPVSTLYGHNGFAGAINYVTKQPGDTFEGNVSATYGNDHQRLLSGSVRGPVIPGLLSLGLAGGYEKNNGGYRDPVNGKRAGGYEKKDFRGSFVLTPTAGVKLSGGLYYGKDKFDTVALVYALDNCVVNPDANPALNEVAFTQYCGPLVFKPLEVSAVTPAAGAAGNDREVYSGNLHLDIDAGFADLALIGGYNKVTQQRFEDFLGRRNNLTFNTTAGPVQAAELFGGDSNNKDYSGEIRLTAKQNLPFRWALGGYYYHNDFTTSTLIGIDKTSLAAGASFTSTAALFATSAGQFSTSNLTLVNGTDEQLSAFASADWDIVENLTLNGEVRYTYQNKSQLIIRNAFIANTVNPYGGRRYGDNKFVNYRGSAKYKFSDEAMVYASVASGTKAFGFNQRFTGFRGEVTFQPEYATAYEIGTKTSLLDRMLTLNAAAFLIDTRNLQAQVPSDDKNNTGLVTKNLGGTREKGFEIEAIISPAPWFRFNMGLAYVDARFRANARDFGSAASCAAIPSCAGRINTTTNAVDAVVKYVSLDGLQVQRVSPYQATAGVTLNGHLTEDVSWFAHSDFRFEDKQFIAANNYAFQPDRTLLNIRAGVEYQNVTVTVFVDNLTKNATVESASANTRLNDFVANPVGFLPTPRRFGVTLGYSF